LKCTKTAESAVESNRAALQVHSNFWLMLRLPGQHLSFLVGFPFCILICTHSVLRVLAIF